MKFFKNYIRDERAATMLEYALFVAGISLAVASALFGYGDDLSNMFTTLGEALTGGE